MSSSNSKDLAAGIAAAAILGIVALVFYSTNSHTSFTPNFVPEKNNTEPSGVQNNPNSQATSSAPATATTKPTTVTKSTTKTSTKASAPATKAYVVDAAKFKASGYFIQLYPGCQATPGSLNVKKGSEVMFDNRNSKGHTIAYKGVNHWLNAYGYAILTFNSVGDNYVTCDGGGSAKVTVFP